MISSLAILSLNSRWMALVARKTWMRGRARRAGPRQARSMSAALQRARPQMIGPSTCAGDGLHRLEVAGRGDGEAGLDDVHAEVREGVGHLQLLGQVHAGAGRLLAVAQGGVEDDQAVVGHSQGLRKTKKPWNHRSQGRCQQSRLASRLMTNLGSVSGQEQEAA